MNTIIDLVSQSEMSPHWIHMQPVATRKAMVITFQPHVGAVVLVSGGLSSRIAACPLVPKQ